MNNRLIKSNDAGGGACTNTVDLYNPFPDGGGVALYQLNGDATDVSGNYDGTSLRGLSYGSGVFGQAVTLASNGNITTNYTLSNSYSISLWSYHNGTGYNLLGDANSSGDNGILFRGFRSNINKVQFIDRWGGGSNYVAHEIDYTNDNAWHHFVLSFTNDNNCKIYMDGALIMNFNSAQSTFTHSTSLSLGQGLSTGFDSSGFSIDQVRIFSRALRPYEVEALYTEEYCTPTIVPSEHFNTVTYTGTGLNQQVSGVGFQPDLVWIKSRSGAFSHVLQDSVRGSYAYLSSNGTDAENTNSNRDWFRSFDSDGFALGPYIATSGEPAANWNEINQTYVAWTWKAGGAAVTNTDGTITSQVSANTEAGFSVVSYSGGNSSGTTVGHGLGKQLDMLIVKNRNDSTDQWITWHKDVERNSTSTDTFTLKGGNVLALNLTNSTISYNYDGQMGSIGGENLIAYCFAEVEGFSSFGSYVGTGASGPTVITGFEPAFVMIKRTDTTSQWLMYDNKRGQDFYLYPNLSAAESGPDALFQFLENGFQLTGGNADWNASGGSYIYMAFAADPTAVEPTLEDSFNTVTYTGNEVSGRQITGVGFQPDFVWIKDRGDGTHWHNLFDSVRGASERLFSNTTNAESFYNESLQSFDNDGFTVGLDPDVNRNGGGIVAWNWKGAEIPAINSNGSIPSVVSANPAAGFSIVSYTGNGSTGTIGHGLSSAPSMLIIKNRSLSTNWVVGSNEIGWNYSLNLNDTSAAGLSTNRFNATSPTSSVFSVGATSVSNGSGNSMIAYCFAEVAGFSKFGSYVGSGSSNTQTITTNFEPAFVLIKDYTAGGSWWIQDNKRTPSKSLKANSSDAESTTNYVTFTSTGFTVTSGLNSNSVGSQFIYMAFANQF